jgi:RNA polymerase sigma-70 factor (ECF subfamily)
MLASNAINANPKSRVPAAAKELRDGLVKLQPELFGRALRMTRSRELAEDLVQDTVERAIRFQDQYKHDTNLRAWVHQILFSVFVTRCRRARLERKALGVLSTDPCAWTSADGGPEMQQLSPPVQRALDELPAGFRLAVVLVDIEEMSYKAAAQTLRVPVGTVMSRLHRGRRALADAMRGAEVVREAA